MTEQQIQKKSITVELDAQEVKLCEYIGKLRSEIARKNNVFDAKIGDHDGTKADVQGFKAEYAFAKHNNLFPDFGLSPRSGSADGVTRSNSKYDIKSTSYKTGNLLSTLKINKDIDVYILAYVNKNKVFFIGWATKDELIDKKNIKDLGHGSGYFLSRHKLHQF
jgi:hypothetical protein